MLYISAYQVIKEHIVNNTKWGAQLENCKMAKELNLQAALKDEFNEAEYSPVHYDPAVVMALLQYTVQTKMTNQKYVLLEGLCNNSKLGSKDDKLEIRSMDEFIDIEKSVGQVKAIIGLQFQEENPSIDTKGIEFEDAENIPKAQVKLDDDGNPVPLADGEKPPYNPADYKWSKIKTSEPDARNLP